MTAVLQRCPTVAEHIEEHGVRIAKRKCHICGYFTLYDCGSPDRQGPNLIVRGLCDTDREEMKALRMASTTRD